MYVYTYTIIPEISGANVKLYLTKTSIKDGTRDMITLDFKTPDEAQSLANFLRD